MGFGDGVGVSAQRWSNFERGPGGGASSRSHVIRFSDAVQIFLLSRAAIAFNKARFGEFIRKPIKYLQLQL